MLCNLLNKIIKKIRVLNKIIIIAKCTQIMMEKICRALSMVTPLSIRLYILDKLLNTIIQVLYTRHADPL